MPILFVVPKYSEAPYLTECGLRSLIEYSNASAIACPQLNSGLSVEIMFIILQLIREKYPPNENGSSYHIYQDTETTDFVKYLDTIQSTPGVCSLPCLYYSHSRSKLMKYTLPVFSVRNAVIYSQTLSSQILFSAFNVFQSELWLFIAAYFLLYQLAKRISARITLKIIPNYFLKNRHLAWLGLTTALLLSLYRAGILSTLLLKHNPIWFSNVEDLAESIQSGRAIPVFYAGDLSSPTREALARYPLLANSAEGKFEYLAHPPESIIDYVKKDPDRAVAIADKMSFVQISVMDVQFRVMDLPELAPIGYVSYCNNLTEARYIEMLNDVIYELTDILITTQLRYENMVWENYARYRMQPYDRFIRAFDLKDFAFDFILLYAGLFLAALGLLLELACYLNRRQRA